MIPVKVIGIGLSPDDITVKQDKLIRNADILIGGARQLKIFDDLNVRKIKIKNNLGIIVETIQKNIDSSNIVVLASGDPLFYGIGSYLIKKIGEKKVEVLPNISSVAKAFSKINKSWQNAHLLSLHGNRSENISILFEPVVSSNDKWFCLLTDKTKDPAWIAKKLIDKNETGFTMCILEKLDSKDEKITWYDDLEKIKENTFLHPNIVILKKEPSSPVLPNSNHVKIGINDEKFHCENGLITKSEIRSIVLSKLNFVSRDHVFWDLGAGSGSVAIEASSFIPKGRIFALEKNQYRISLIEKNLSAFNVKNINVIQAQLPDGLAKLPIPDRIFIGGGGKDLKAIAQNAITKLSINGIIVINTILIQNLEPVVAIMKDLGIKPQILSVQISRSKDMPFGDRFEPLNPVWIIHGKKEN
jgi:precorrin-6B C5,15-methyltransferase / cobalt-precorrin-6B C5,C15-methyltransferase